MSGAAAGGAANPPGALAARLPAFTLYAAILSGAGLPIYIYAPEFYASEYGVSLAALGAVLFGLRLLDVVQDPLLGWVAERLGDRRRIAAFGGSVLLGLAMILLFAVPPQGGALLWFALSLALLFTAFSFLTILFYAQGIAKAAALPGGHVRLAAWRESGSLLGVCIAAAAPALLVFTGAPFATYAAAFAVLAVIAAGAMAPEWSGSGTSSYPIPVRTILRDRQARRLLILAFVNGAPVAVSSTLFLFYVDGRLEAPGWEGPLLILFFLSAALAAPIWARAGERFGPKRVLLTAMAFAVLVFAWTLTLGAGDVAPFAVVCILSGATIGADLTLLPALFARRMAHISPNGGQGFGLWSLMSKATLAVAAAILLPILDASGYVAGETAPETARTALTVLYALVPCTLKLVAIAILAMTTLSEDE